MDFGRGLRFLIPNFGGRQSSSWRLDGEGGAGGSRGKSTRGVDWWDWRMDEGRAVVEETFATVSIVEGITNTRKGL